MTKVDGDIWQYTFAEDPSGLDGFLFCDGKASGGDQTANCSSAPVNGHLYTGSGNKGAIADLGVYDTTPVDPNADVFVYLVGVDWPQPYVYIYNGDKYLEKWPGVAMEMVDGRWTYQLPDEYKNCMVIFSDNGNSQYPAMPRKNSAREMGITIFSTLFRAYRFRSSAEIFSLKPSAISSALPIREIMSSSRSP